MTAARFRIWLAVITAIGAAWRIGYLVVAKLGEPLLLNDSLYFSIQAGRNSEGDWFREGLTNLPGAEHGPLTSLYLTPWSLGSGDNVDWQRFAITLLGIATIAVIGLVGLRLAGPRVGLVAAAIAAVYPNLWINDSLVMSETLALLLVSLALLVALDLDRRPGPWRAVLLGVLVGLATLTRSELGLLAVGFAGAGVVAGGRPTAAVRCSRCSCWRPPPSRCCRGWSTTPGASSARCCCRRTTARRCSAPTARRRTTSTSAAGTSAASTRCRTTTRSTPRCARWSGATSPSTTSAITSVGSRWSCAARVGRALDLYGLGSLVALDRGEEKADWAVWAGIVCWWVLAIAAIFGWRRLGRDEVTRRSRWWLAVPLLTVLVTTIAFYGAHRIRAPAEPAVVLLAAVAAVDAWDRVRARRVAHSPA